MMKIKKLQLIFLSIFLFSSSLLAESWVSRPLAEIFEASDFVGIIKIKSAKENTFTFKGESIKCGDVYEVEVVNSLKKGRQIKTIVSEDALKQGGQYIVFAHGNYIAYGLFGDIGDEKDRFCSSKVDNNFVMSARGELYEFYPQYSFLYREELLGYDEYGVDLPENMRTKSIKILGDNESEHKVKFINADDFIKHLQHTQASKKE